MTSPGSVRRMASPSISCASRVAPYARTPFMGELGPQGDCRPRHCCVARGLLVRHCHAGVERGDGLVVGESLDGVVARKLEVVHGALRARQPRRSGARARERPRQACPATVPPGQILSGSAVELASLRAQHPPVSGLLDEGMSGTGTSAQERFRHLLQEARAGELF